MSVGRPALRHVAIFAFFVVLSVILTWPLAIRLDQPLKISVRR